MLGEEGDQVNDYPSSLDYRDKGHVTSVSSLYSNYFQLLHEF